jgi:thiol-disulfide isomerase/thioredoxin
VPVGVIVVVAVLAVATAAGLAWRRRDGRLRQSRNRPGQPEQRRLAGSDVGQPLGERVTLLQFSSSFCAPCRATRQLLADVAARTQGVAHIEIDVADRLDLVRLLDIRRTPTTLVLGPHGQITQRASGLPRREEVLTAVTAAAGTSPADLGNPTSPRRSDSAHGPA